LRNFDTDPPEISVVPAYTAPAAPRPAATQDKPARDPRTIQGDVTIGKAAGDAMQKKAAPVDAAIVGIIDHVDIPS